MERSDIRGVLRCLCFFSDAACVLSGAAQQLLNCAAIEQQSHNRHPRQFHSARLLFGLILQSKTLQPHTKFPLTLIPAFAGPVRARGVGWHRQQHCQLLLVGSLSEVLG